MKVQFNRQIEESLRDRFDKFVANNMNLFERQGAQAQAAELVIEAGLDICEKEAAKIQEQKQLNKK